MTIDATSALTGGGAGTLILAIAYAYRQFKAARHEDRSAPISETSAAVADAAAANSMLLTALQDERKAVKQLSAEVADLRGQNTDLYQRMREQRREYEQIVAELSSRVDSLSAQVDAFKRRLSADDEG